MIADVVVRGSDALASVLRAEAVGRIFAVEVSEAPVEVVRVQSWNRGILLSERDVALVDTPIAQTLLAEMLRELAAHDRLASLAQPGCVLLRRWVLNAIGALDGDSVQDWQERAKRLGLRHSLERKSWKDAELLRALS